jgi:hypothetical protein
MSSFTKLRHLSFSAIKDASECPYRFKLGNIDKIRLRKQSIDTIFGTLLHNCIQDYLFQNIDIEVVKKKFIRIWKRFCKLYVKHLNWQKISQFLFAGVNIIKHVPAAFEGYTAIAVEEKLEIPIGEKHEHVNFKGYVDLVLKNKDDKLLIADLKTAKSAYMFGKYLDAMKRNQLRYYRHFYAKKHNLKAEDIDTCFIVLEKDPASKAPIQFLNEKVTTRTTNNSLKIIDNLIESVKKEEFPKNKESCWNEKGGFGCNYYKTEHCK